MFDGVIKSRPDLAPISGRSTSVIVYIVHLFTEFEAALAVKAAGQVTRFPTDPAGMRNLK